VSTPEVVEDTPEPNGAPTPEAMESRPNDIQARILADPDFALDQWKKAQSNGTKLAQKLKSLQPVEEVASRLEGGASTVAQLVYEHSAVLQHPEVRRIVEHYRQTGTLPTASAQRSDVSDDEYVDPVDVMKNELNDLKAQLAQVTGHVHRDRTLIAQQSMQANMQTLRQKYENIWDIIEPALVEQAEKWESSPQGRDYLSNATLDTWDNIAKIAIGGNLDVVAQRMAEKRVQGTRALGTEPSPQTVTSGREQPVKSDESWRPGMARKLIQDQWRREGRIV